MPLLRQALSRAEGLSVIDCPPGSACSVMESIMDADYCLLVAEPTAFGFHNFQMVHELAALLGKPYGVVVNKRAGEYAPITAANCRYFRFTKSQRRDTLAGIIHYYSIHYPGLGDLKSPAILAETFG